MGEHGGGAGKGSRDGIQEGLTERANGGMGREGMRAGKEGQESIGQMREGEGRESKGRGGGWEEEI